MPTIRRLSDATINRIAAGEVLERPASAVKELVENALDAGATRIRIDIAHGGKSLIRITDNGGGIAHDDLPLALERHATSKLDEDDIFDIRHLGFRGEALASIGSVARLRITSRTADGDGWSIEAEGGRVSPPRPAGATQGTVVEVRDLFYATPARLKFLHGDTAETQAIADTVRRLAMAAPGVGFELQEVSDGARALFRAPAETGDLLEQGRARVAKILGQETLGHCIRVHAQREGLALEGWIGTPEHTRGSTSAQYLFVNGRSVRDKTLNGALRAAYQDMLPPGKHPIAVLFLTSAPGAVDVNVHPTKAEVRFKDSGLVRGLIVGALRAALAEQGHHTLHGFTPTPQQDVVPGLSGWRPTHGGQRGPSWAALENARVLMAPGQDLGSGGVQPTSGVPTFEWTAIGRFALAHTPDGLYAVDMGQARAWMAVAGLHATPVPSHPLLLPDVTTLDSTAATTLAAHGPALAALGFGIEPFGTGAVLLRAVPQPAAGADARTVLAAALGQHASHADRVVAIAQAIARSTPAGHNADAVIQAVLGGADAPPTHLGQPLAVALSEEALARLFAR
jgi:DNA mismatch repair protein MutL